MGTFLLTALVILLTLGAIAYVAERRHRDDRPFGRMIYSLLPGDIKYESPNGNFRFYFPITTSIVVSLVLTLILNLFS